MSAPEASDEIAALSTPPAATEARCRPPGVPATAAWVEGEGEWQDARLDAKGRLDGAFRSWRADGSRRTVATYQGGRQVGPMWTFHPDGSLHYLGLFVDGNPRGEHRRYANRVAGAEPLQVCCVPAGAWQLRQTFGPEGLRTRHWLDRDGGRLLDSGRPYPERPPSVPLEAEVDESVGMWQAGAPWAPGGRSGTRRRWSLDGVLRLVEDLDRDQRHGTVRSFFANGELAWEAHYSRNRLFGPFESRGLPAGHFADPALRREEGSFLDDQACGGWRFLDDQGVLLGERDLGLPLDPDALTASPALDRQRRPAADWLALATALGADGRCGEALLAEARAAAEAGEGARLGQALAARTMPLGADAARIEARNIVERASGKLVPLVDGLKRGADPAILLCAIGRALPGTSRAADDLLTASLLLDPSSIDTLRTRVLLRASLGALESTPADIARIAAESPEQGQLLELVMRAYFPRFDFWPASVGLDAIPDADGPRLERSLDEVRDAVARYVTRLMRLRAAIRARVAGDPPFLLPDLSALLPDGPVPLRSWTFTMSVEEYTGEAEAPEAGGDDPATSLGEGDTRGVGSDREEQAASDDAEAGPACVEIIVDEAAGLIEEPEDLLPVMRQARADWSGLTWLCWAAGLAGPGLPEELSPPPSFGRAAIMTMERAWRCRDKIKTSGLMALGKGIPGFDWEGVAIDFVPSTLAGIALGEYVEARAVFAWLCDTANRSPWQGDLRAAE